MRIAAWLCFLVCIAFPAWVWWTTSQMYAAADRAGRYVCGLPEMGVIIVGAGTWLLVGGLAALYAWRRFRNAGRPRALVARLETGILMVPFLAGSAIVLLSLLGIAAISMHLV